MLPLHCSWGTFRAQELLSLSPHIIRRAHRLGASTSIQNLSPLTTPAARNPSWQLPPPAAQQPAPDAPVPEIFQKSASKSDSQRPHPSCDG